MFDPTSLHSLEELQQLLNTLNERLTFLEKVARDERGTAQRHQRREDLHDEQRRIGAG